MFGFLKKKAKKDRVVVLGIDGVPCSLLHRFIAEGLMPNLAKLAAKGTLADMTASIPEVSSTSWTTFMTGVNPGRHGIYGFMELQKGTYQWRFPNSSDIKSSTLWDIAGRHNKKSIVLNVPSTYPARPLNGILTAGFVALDLKKATYPDSAYQYLEGIGYRMDVDTKKAQESLSALADDIDKTFVIRKNAILHFLDNHEWDLFIGVITETDRLHHYLWAALEDAKHPQHNFFIDFYRKLDAFIGEAYERTGDDVPFIILSDHGSTAIKQEIYLNSWLREKGYLKFIKDSPKSLEDIDGESTVFALDPSRLYIHMKGKYPRGGVGPQDYERLRLRLKEDLLSMTVEGEKVIKAVFFKEDLYSGVLSDEAPDVVALSNEGYDLKGTVNKTQITGRSFLTGGHTRGDAVFYINRKVPATDINIIDVGPTIISLLNIREDSFDGKCLV
ncbi:MAG: alkaline phosphatase family protein [Nitrospirae bacterium]|nr:alkaline phosphatase family protein [Nitrospirota bacterium]